MCVEKALNQLIHDAAVLFQVVALYHNVGLSWQDACREVAEHTGRSVSSVERACRRARQYCDDAELQAYF